MRLVRVLSRVLLLLTVVLLVGVGAWWGTHRDEVRATWRAVIVASELRGSAWSDFVRERTSAPRTAQLRTVGDLPATLVLPGDAAGPWATTILVVPSSTSDDEQEAVLRTQRGLARAGFAAWAVRAPDVVTTGTSDTRLERALTEIADKDGTRGRSISVLAAGLQAAQVVDLAGRPELDARIAALLLVQPVADARSLLRLAVTSTTRDADGRDRTFPAATSLRPRAGRALVDVLRERPAIQRSPVARRVLDLAARDEDPLTALGRVPAIALPVELRAAQRALAADDPAAFDTAWDALPAPLRIPLEARSALLAAPRVQARVLVLADPGSTTYPATDAARLAQALRSGGRDDEVRHRELAIEDGPPATGMRDAWPLVRDAAWWLERAAADRQE